MATFDPGNSSLSSITYESALIEAIGLYRRYLAPNSTANPTFTVSQNGTAVTGLTSIPLSISTGSNGTISISTVNETDSSFTWIQDSLSDANADSLPGMILALASKINAGTPLQGQTVDRCSVSVNIDAKIAQISVNFAMTVVDVDDPAVALAFQVADYIADFS